MALTVETVFEHGAIYGVDFQHILVTCEECGRSFPYRISRPKPKCRNCGSEIDFESRQIGSRPHVVLGSQATFPARDTVVTVPVSSTQFAKLQPFAVEVQPSDQNGLEAVSYLLPTKIRCVNTTSIFAENRLGMLSKSDLLRLHEALRQAILAETAGEST